MRILVIESNVTVAMITRGLLRRWGHHADIQGAPSPDAALPEPGDWDLVIAEPASNPAALRALRRGNVPWIALVSARDSTDAAAWVAKPFKPDELRAALLRCFKVEDTIDPVGGIDAEAITALWGGVDNKAFRQIAIVFLGEIGERRAALGAAFLAEDRRILHREAHSIASAAANVGCVAIAQAARALEAVALEAEFGRLLRLVAAIETISLRDAPILRRIATDGQA